jgi:hypothetical protein
MFNLNGDVISAAEAELIRDTIEFKQRRDAEKAAIQAQVAQEMALRQALASPQAQAMVNAQYGAG